MKNLFKGLLLIIILFQAYSCKRSDILDAKPNTDLNQETTFADSARTSDFLFGIYADIAADYGTQRNYSITAGTAEASDEAHHRLGAATQPFVQIITGNLRPINDENGGNHPYRFSWDRSFSNIRKVNVFLANVDSSPFSAGLKTSSKAEARFLRAWYYSILLKSFGGVPIIRDRLFLPDDIIDAARDSYEDCVNYIVSELTEIENDLPPSQNAQNYGRITSVACRALKSRILLYAASPLTNGGNMGQTEEQKKVLGYDAYDVNRWTQAAQAAKATLDLASANGYGLHENNTIAPGYGFSEVFLLRRNIEFLLPGMMAPGKRLEGAVLPPSTGTGQVQTVPSQNLAEAFGMINGKTTADPSFNPNAPYANRDPRFNYTLIFNGTLWYKNSVGRKMPVYTYERAPQDGYGILPYFTGYFRRKMMDENVTANAGSNPQRVWPLIRYAEIMLNYAEASNESGSINIAYDQLKLIRKRAGIIPGSDGMYGLKADMTTAEMRELILNERQVEFAFEDHRYWDVRRTKTAMEKMNFTMTAMKIIKSGVPATVSSTDTYQYEKVPVNANSGHIFVEANYWFPIQQSEINKDPKLIQNPGY